MQSTKPALALALGQALWASELFPGRWVTCDASFGNNEELLAPLPTRMYYLAEIPCTRTVWLKQAPGHPAPETEGAKGPLVASFARVRVYVSAERTPASERWLLVRNDPGGQLKYALSNAPESESFGELIRVSAARWPIERCFQEDKSELGLDHYEHRSWTAWHRHMRLVFLAHLSLVQLRRRSRKSPDADAAPGARPAGVEPAVSADPIGVCAQVGAVTPGTQSPSLPLPSQTPAPGAGDLEGVGAVAAGLNGKRDHHPLPSITAGSQTTPGLQAMPAPPFPDAPGQRLLLAAARPFASP